MKKALLLPLSLLTLGVVAALSAPKPKLYEGEPIQALLITGGCCHNYLYQSKQLTQASKTRADIEWTVLNEGGTGTAAQIPLYNNPDWAKDFDVVVHNECFAKTTDPEYIRKITAGHQKNAVPAVVIHCAMHTYRDAEIDDWRELLGVTSRRHDHQSHYAVKVTEAGEEHPALVDLPRDWKTPKDELYIIEKLWPSAKALATSVSEKDGKAHPVIWENDYQGIRVFGTTYGHSDETFGDSVFLEYVTRGIVWAAGK